jgi:hypothetical protein
MLATDANYEQAGDLAALLAWRADDPVVDWNPVPGPSPQRPLTCLAGLSWRKQ